MRNVEFAKQILPFKFIFQNLRSQIERVAKFLEKDLTEEQLTRLTDHLRFANFEKNESVNLESVRREGIVMNNNNANIKFIRKGLKNHYF